MLIPNFEIEDILGSFDHDKKGNIIFSKWGTILKPVLFDKTKHLVNGKGYLIDSSGNIVNRAGEIIFKKDQLDESGELPAPFVYDKHKRAFL